MKTAKQHALLVAAAADHLKDEREQVARGYDGRSALSQREAVALADEIERLRAELADLRQYVARRNHA